MSVAVVAWQCFALAADLRVMGRGPQEWLMAPLAMGNLMMMFTPLNNFIVLLGERMGGLGLFGTLMISLANALLLLSPYWLLRRRWRWLVWIPLTLLTLWCLMQLCYCRAYDDLMPWKSLTLTGNLNTTLMDSTISLLRWHDLLIVVPFLLLVCACVVGRRVGSHEESARRSKPFFLTLFACLLATVMGYGNINENYEKRYLHNFSNRGYYMQNGLIPYGIYTLYHTFYHNHALSEEERDELNRFLTEECPQYTDNSHCSVAGRNLVLIIVESLHTWPIGMEVEGREVTPVLNSLVRGDSVIYAPHVLFQTSHGHSSDAHSSTIPVWRLCATERWPWNGVTGIIRRWLQRSMAMIAAKSSAHRESIGTRM